MAIEAEPQHVSLADIFAKQDAQMARSIRQAKPTLEIK